jgi:hypothetical protein
MASRKRKGRTKRHFVVNAQKKASLINILRHAIQNQETLCREQDQVMLRRIAHALHCTPAGVRIRHEGDHQEVMDFNALVFYKDLLTDEQRLLGDRMFALHSMKAARYVAPLPAGAASASDGPELAAKCESPGTSPVAALPAGASEVNTPLLPAGGSGVDTSPYVAALPAGASEVNTSLLPAGSPEVDTSSPPMTPPKPPNNVMVKSPMDKNFKVSDDNDDETASTVTPSGKSLQTCSGISSGTGTMGAALSEIDEGSQSDRDAEIEELIEASGRAWTHPKYSHLFQADPLDPDWLIFLPTGKRIHHT